MDITDVKRRLAERAVEVAEVLLPGGRKEGHEWRAGSTGGERGKSLGVRVTGAKAGTWADFASGESGDLLDLWRIVRGVPLVTALVQAREWLGVAKPSFEKAAKTYRRPEKPKCRVPKSLVLDYLTVERNLSPEAIAAFRVGEDGGQMVLPSLLPDGTLAAVKFLGVARDDRGKKITRVEPGCEPVLFGWQASADKLSAARSCTITEGELDALSAWDYGCPVPLSVPFGGGKGAKQQWIDAEFDRLAQFETIYLALDMDAEGDAAVQEIVGRLGRHRCRRVSLPCKDLNECLVSGVPKAAISAAFAAAKTSDPPELQSAGSHLDSVLAAFFPVEGVQAGYSTPWNKLRGQLLFRPGEMTLWTGATGMGKSQALGHAICGFGEQGGRVCIASFEMSPTQLLRRMVTQSINTLGSPSEAIVRRAIAWMDEWLWIFGRVGKAGVGEVLEIFEYARRRYGCDIFVVDSLMRLGVGSEDYEGQEKAVFQLVNWALENGVHIHLVAHARKSDAQHAGPPDSEAVKGASEIGSNAANIIGIWRNRKAEDHVRTLSDRLARGDTDAKAEYDEVMKKPTVILNVAKQRNGDFEGKIGLWFSVASYQYRGFGDDPHGHDYVRLGGDPVNIHSAGD